MDFANEEIQTCPSLYCTQSWYTGRNVSPKIIREVVRQFRPSQSEFAVLSQKGFVVNTGKHSLPIVPNMAHLAVQNFYRGKPASRVIQAHADGGMLEAMVTAERDMLMRSDSLRATPAKNGNQVNLSLDPRLQGKFAYITAANPSEPVAFGAAKHTIYGAATHSTAAPNHVANEQAENKLRNLEEEVLRLRMEIVLKDYEIRMLKIENEKRSGNGYETGSKRPCY
jgi:hypothetical protein